MTEPTTTPTSLEPEAAPEGVVDIQGAKMVPLGALEAERKRARETTEQRVRSELAPVVKQAEQAQQLQQDIAALRPQLEYLQAHPELLKELPAPPADDITDEQAEKYAKQYELFTATGLDTARAKRIIRDTRSEMMRVAKTVAEETMQPMRQQTATQASRANYVWAASQRDAQGQTLVDHEQLAKMWASFPAELTAQPDVARVVLNAAIGEAIRTRAGGPQPPEAEPIHSESVGGGPAASYRISDIERRVAKAIGIKEADYSKTAKSYQPGEVNVLGD